MRQMNELFNKHERVWFSLLEEESQRQFLQAIGHVAADLVWRYCTSWIVLMDGLEDLPLAFLSQKREPDPFVFVE